MCYACREAIDVIEYMAKRIQLKLLMHKFACDWPTVISFNSIDTFYRIENQEPEFTSIH